MTNDTPSAIALRFNDCINRGDLEGLASLMTPGHAFIDSANHAIHGREKALKAWKSFFERFPDYRNVFEKVTAFGGLVAITGHSTCSDRRLDGPAIWTAQVENGAVGEWRVYQDTPEIRQQLGIP